MPWPLFGVAHAFKNLRFRVSGFFGVQSFRWFFVEGSGPSDAGVVPRVGGVSAVCVVLGQRACSDFCKFPSKTPKKHKEPQGTYVHTCRTPSHNFFVRGQVRYTEAIPTCHSLPAYLAIKRYSPRGFYRPATSVTSDVLMYVRTYLYLLIPIPSYTYPPTYLPTYL